MPANFLYPDTVGGIMHMEYGQPGSGVVHAIHLALLPFAGPTLGSEHDYVYTGAGPIVPTETGVLATFDALGSLWAAYYPPSWSLRLVRLYSNVAGFALALPTVPATSPVYGTANPDSDLDLVVQRTLSMYSELGARWRTWLRQMPGVKVGQAVTVGVDVGGIDSRDRDWFAYISSDDTGVIARDGARFQPGGRVRQWWDKTPTAGISGPYLITG